MVGESQEPVGAGVGGSQSSNKTPTLEEYGTNLTKQAEEVCPFNPAVTLVYVLASVTRGPVSQLVHVFFG